MTTMRQSPLLGFVLGLAFLIPRGGVAKIDLVTLPARDQTQITIYSNDDLTLARESRTVTFRKGLNRIEFSWANTLIDPTSPQLFFPDRPDAFEILDITYPANTGNLLQWNVEAEESGPAQIEITYFISGLSWQADYVMKSNPGETEATLEGYVRVTNTSGEEFENVQTRLLVGTVNLVEAIADLARRGIVYNPVIGTVSEGDVFRADRDAGQLSIDGFALYDLSASSAGIGGRIIDRVKEIAKKEISEYQLYTIEGTEDIPNGWSKRLRSFSIDHVTFEVAYESDPEKYAGELVVKMYKLKNDAEHKLGKDPLPDGTYRVVRDDGAGGLVWEGQYTEKYVPVGEKLEINLGPDGLVTVEDQVMDFERSNVEFDTHRNVSGWDERQAFRIEIRNSKSVAAPIKLVRHFEGDWEIEPPPDTSSVSYMKKDQRTVEFETTVDALGTTRIEFDVTTRMGSRSR